MGRKVELVGELPVGQLVPNLEVIRVMRRLELVDRHSDAENRVVVVDGQVHDLRFNIRDLDVLWRHRTLLFNGGLSTAYFLGTRRHVTDASCPWPYVSIRSGYRPWSPSALPWFHYPSASLTVKASISLPC